MDRSTSILKTLRTCGLGLILVLAISLVSRVEAQSSRPGIGATLYDDAQGNGVTFRTWAPNADSVSVAGSFNSFNPNTHFLSSESNGWWSIDVPYVGQGARYKFVIRNGGDELWRRDPWARRLTNSVGDPLVYDQDAYQFQAEGFTMPPWNELVIYEMHIGTFGALEGDSVPANFQDCIDNLDHLMELGVNCVELMPINEFTGDINWGYNLAYPWSVESSYGGPDQLKAFVDACHARGIAVILDVLYNHWGPSDLDLWQYDGWSENDRSQENHPSPDKEDGWLWDLGYAGPEITSGPNSFTRREPGRGAVGPRCLQT